MNLVIVNLGQVMRTPLEQVPPKYPTTPSGNSELDRFNGYQPALHGGFSLTLLVEPKTLRPRVRDHNQ
ncbi:hypothetical protein TNCV_1339371 [Trichonephila clavipes]|uniref:Uncharacterized protein n=1 Tax=Trichonephila clavipes TaxID=2585209 RepID=A0A8X6UZG0_TRICX|nr:hypothetical protein TNCV_1339371 [Trichonephila clavipes]